MHVLFVSACEKRAIKRTRAILDSYALRTGEKAWASPMTQEGLREIRSALKATATRQTAVACYRNEGRQRMKLLWVVGSRKAFGADGHFPVGTTRIKQSQPIAAWVRVAALLAQAAGWCHDLGKSSILFQDKLRKSGPVKDCVRHEWVSMRLAQAMRAGKSWESAWAEIGKDNWLKGEPFEQGIHTAWDALDYLIVTHHRLLGPVRQSGQPDDSNHFSDEALQREKLKPKAALPGTAFDTAKRLMARVIKLAEGKDYRYWRAVAGIARAGLILADHQVSAENRPGNAELYANTNKDGQLNQPLLWHLENVANTAADKVYRLATLRLAGLSEEAVESMGQTAAAAFRWQNAAADGLAAFREKSSAPALLFNMAATGSGKTRMNARAACALSNGPVRFAVALNLRSLTLQTGDALRQQLNIGADELACVIGDKTAQRLHERGKQAAEDEDGNLPEAEFETLSEEFFLPAWLEPLAKAKPVLKAVLGAPVLVSTVDFLIAAGMPHTQGHHACALLRLADSDLVLDEVDGYDPKPLVAVLRLVQLSALFGRNVICSTATLAEPVALAVFQAYHSGATLRGEMLGQEARFACAMIDNYTATSIEAQAMALDFQEFYRWRIGQARAGFGHGRQRVPYLQMLDELSTPAWKLAVQAAVLRLHGDHGWRHTASGKQVSFGLVRMANIGPAIETARFLAGALPQARVACYHAQDYVIQRYLKEKRLDELLTRKVGNRNLEQDSELNDILLKADSDEVVFIVVATPVEEIGRDHDFDWAVIEPSSVRSIVQTSGRVNRHRNDEVDRPNIAVLQYNWKAAEGKDKMVFTRPGFETGDTHPCHDVGKLLDWSKLVAINAGLLFDGHCFAEWDNASIHKSLDKVMAQLFDVEKTEPFWANQGIYEQYPLRDNEAKIEMRLTEDGNYEIFRQEHGKKPEWVLWDGRVRRVDEVKNDWLSRNHEALFESCREHGVELREGMRFSVSKDSFSFDLSFGAH